MATLDDELARFEKEIAAVEAAQPEEGQITTQVVMSAPAQSSQGYQSVNGTVSISRAQESFNTPPPSMSHNYMTPNSVPPLESSYFRSSYDNPSRNNTSNLPRDIYGNYYDPSLVNQNQSYDFGGSDSKAISQDKIDNNVKELAKTIVPQNTIFRKAAGDTGVESWADPTLSEWPENDFRVFVGDLGNEVNDEMLSKAFQRYRSFNKAKVIRDNRTGKSKGYGFISLGHWEDYAKAMKEMNGKYCGNRPMKLRKSNWKERMDVNPDRKTMKKAKKILAEKQAGVITGGSSRQEASNEPSLSQKVSKPPPRWRPYLRR